METRSDSALCNSEGLVCAVFSAMGRCCRKKHVKKSARFWMKVCEQKGRTCEWSSATTRRGRGGRGQDLDEGL